MASQTAWYVPSCLVQVDFVNLFVSFTLEELLGLLKALAEISRLDIPDVRIYFYCYTGCIGRRSWKTPFLILFDWQMSLLL